MITDSPTIALGVSSAKQPFLLQTRMATRHGLIAGATGTGKTVTLQVLAEQFCLLGSSVFLADVKGDLSGLIEGGELSRIDGRLKEIGLDTYSFRGFPVTFWDLFGECGIPVRATISEVGPLLLAHILELSQTQSEILQITFSIADDEGLLLLDIKDLEALLQEVAKGSSIDKEKYGALHPNSLAVIQRRLVVLRETGGELFFGEPALTVQTLLPLPSAAIGTIHLLQAQKLISSPRIYSAFLLSLLSDLFEQLPEVGDIDVPKLVFFFDEAHLLFDRASKSLEDQIVGLVRLIRSKGVAVFFITQHPLDLPDEVNAQLGTRIQHGLRAYTEKELRNVRAVAKSFRANPDFDTYSTLTELGVGEALVSSLDRSGAPTPVQRVVIAPPHSRIGPAEAVRVAQLVKSSPLYGVFAQPSDRHSAHEVLAQRQEHAEATEEERAAVKTTSKGRGSSTRMSTTEAVGRSILRSFGSYIGRTVARGIMGAISHR